MTGTFEINGREIGTGHPAYIVAEMSANHHQDFSNAADIVRAAKDAGADAVKVQTYTPDTLTIDCDNEYFRIHGTLWNGRTLYSLYQEACMPWEWHSDLKKLSESLGMDLISTPFDATAVDYLEGVGLPAYKVASFELVDIPLLRKIARTGKPVLISTGMATLAEIQEAVETIRKENGAQVALLKCTSAYPAPAEELNLRTIPHLAETFHVPVGLSDHTLGFESAICAVSLGACIIEKHFTISRSAGGPDSGFSMEPGEFSKMVEAIRTVEKALGKVNYEITERESESRVFRRSLFVVQDMKAGDLFTTENVRSVRPAHGLHTRHLDEVLGRRAAGDLKRGTPLQWEMVE